MTVKRNRRAGVEDLWTKEVLDENKKAHRVPSKLHGKGKRWRARYVDDAGNEHTKRFARKADAQAWLDAQVASLVQGIHVAPRDSQKTVEQWANEWLKGYANHRETTVELATWHVKKINEGLGSLQLSAVRPSTVKKWMVALKSEGLADSYVYSLHSRLAQILGDAMHDGLLARNPCSRRTSPKTGQQKVYVATSEQVWALHEAMPAHLRVAVLLGAFVGLRISEAAGLRTADVDFANGIVQPRQQWPGRELKTESSTKPVPIPPELVAMLEESAKVFPGDHLVCDEFGKPVSPWVIGWHLRAAKEKVHDLPEAFSFQDFRHFYASLLIRRGADIKAVQARLRHGSAITTLRYYAHLWPDADETTRTAVGAAIKDWPGSTAYSLRTETEQTDSTDDQDSENAQAEAV
ncbi:MULTISPECIES: tyrosine-type recombinase/integrase [Nocardia]|uniref:Site-specific integrase n=1 Tax=Nocardia nova TaxID=37330 RepID=A0A2T2YVE4_9NOCA|nr:MULTISPECIES: site-specific integrase [Nocardia]PSR59466.1 site-specific integrase [Nocardia nova]